MGCTDSTQVLENKNKSRSAFNMIQNTSFVEGEDLYLMGQVEEGKHILATITTSRIPALIINPNAKSPITLKELPKIIQKPMTLQQVNLYGKDLPTFKPYNFSQMIRIPSQTTPHLKNQQCWYFVSGGINYKLSDITSSCYIFNSKYNAVEKLPELNQPRYTHCSLIFQGEVYALGGREFGEDDSAILNHCEKYSLKDYVPILYKSEPQPPKQQNKWIQIASMNKSRCTFLAVVHQNKIWAIGGYTGQYERSPILQYYQPSKQNKWHTIDVCIPFGIESVVSLVTNKNQITLFGGNSDSGAMDTVLTLNLFQKNIKACHKLKQKRLLHKSSYSVKQNSIYLFGGNQTLDLEVYKLTELEDEFEQDSRTTSVDINLKKYFKNQETFQSLTHSQSTNFVGYSPVSSLSTEHSPSEGDQIVYILGTSYEPFILQLNISVPYTLYHPIPFQIQMHALQGGVYLKKNMFMILGGITDTMDQVSQRVYIYDTKNRKGKEIEPMVQSRYAFAFEKINKYIYVAGGGTADFDGELVILNKVQRINIDGDVYSAKWEEVADMPHSLISPMSLNYNGFLYIFGGMKKNNERNQSILRYSEETNLWKELEFKFPFGLEASSVIRNTQSEFLIFGGRVSNGDSKGIWALNLIQNGENCVFSEKGQMKEAKCLHKTYRPKKQNFFVIFGGEQQPLSYYDCQSLEPIQSDILLGMKMIFLKNLEKLGERSLKNYLIVHKE